jgi:hypothetical protein
VVVAAVAVVEVAEEVAVAGVVTVCSGTSRI